MAKRLALTVDGNITYCTSSDDNMGKGRCNHIAHQKDGQSIEDFVNSVEEEMKLSTFKSLKLKELKEMYKNKQDIDLLRKTENEHLLRFLIKQGETDFKELTKSENPKIRILLAENGLQLEDLKDDEND